MVDLETPPKMVGREEELEQLKTFLDNAREGHGNTVFIAGEAGVGKTRLLEELKSYAREQGVDVLQGWSLYESLTPYMPFLEALRSGGLENLFADEAPRVEAVYLVSHSGLAIKEVIREETKLDADIFTGMLTAVGDFVKDSLSMLTGEEKKGSLNTLGYENYRIIIESQSDVHLSVILTGRENEFLINDIREILSNVNIQYGDTLSEWDGKEESLRGISKILDRLITSGKYDGIDYAKDNPQIKRNRLFENILLGIERHAKVNPSLLCIEDLQWADPSSLALMHYVARNTRERNLLILGSYRPEDISATEEKKAHPLIKAMQMMDHEDLLQKIELDRLKEEHIDQIITSYFTNSNFPNEFKALLYKETEGNPFFIISLIRMLIDERTIVNEDGLWILSKEVKEPNVPSKVYDVIIRRIFRIDVKDKEILEFASVIGEEFTSDILARAVKINKVELLKQLRILEQNHKLIRSVEHKYKFDHAKIKEVLYQHIPNELRMEYHGIIALNIETHSKDDLDKVIGDLAYHYYRNRNKAKALPYLKNAAEKARENYSNEEAVKFYNQALEFENDFNKRMKIYEILGETFLLMGLFKESIESYNHALNINNNVLKNAEIMLKIGKIYEQQAKYDESLQICIEALKMVKDKGCKEEALALNNIGHAYAHKEKFDKALKYHQKSLIISEKIKDLPGMADSFMHLGFVYSFKEHFDESISSYKKSIEIKERISDQKGIAACLNGIGTIYEDKGDYKRALEYYQRSQMIWEKIGDLVCITKSFHNIGCINLFNGDYDKALEYYTKSQLICEKITYPHVLCANYSRIAETYYKKGDVIKSLDFCKMALDISNRIEWKEYIGFTNRIFGMNYRSQKKWKLSINSFEESIKILSELGFKKHLGDTYFEFGLMWKEKEDIGKAKENLNLALEYYEYLNLEKHFEKVKKELQSCKE